MYNWDLDIIKRNKTRLKNDTNRHAEAILKCYEKIDEFVDGIPIYSCDYSLKPDKFFLSIAYTESELMKTSTVCESKTFEALINQERKQGIINQPIIDNNYKEVQALNLVRNFFANRIINNPFLIDDLIINRGILLKKDDFNRGIYIKDSINNNNFIGVIASNLDYMSYILVHELGHYIIETNELKGYANNETLPFLLELYYYKHIGRKSNDNQYIQKRYTNDISFELSLLKTYYDVLNSNDDDYKIMRLKEQSAIYPLFNFEKTLVYFISKYKALDYYMKTKDCPSTINDLINRERNIRTLRQLVDSVEPELFSSKEESIIKRLVR